MSAESVDESSDITPLLSVVMPMEERYVIQRVTAKAVLGVHDRRQRLLQAKHY